MGMLTGEGKEGEEKSMGWGRNSLWRWRKGGWGMGEVEEGGAPWRKWLHGRGLGAAAPARVPCS
jgi:hypothetical protein